MANIFFNYSLWLHFFPYRQKYMINDCLANPGEYRSESDFVYSAQYLSIYNFMLMLKVYTNKRLSHYGCILIQCICS